jgi:hypothetical protein
VGSNDKYLINKLRSYNINLDKIDSYLMKLKQDNGVSLGLSNMLMMQENVVAGTSMNNNGMNSG